MADIEGSNSSEVIIGTYLSDDIYGYGGNDTLRGGFQNDRLYGGDGNDLLLGDFQDDRLYGENGADRLYGGAGDDYFYGGAGADRMEGGEGRDTFDQTDLSEAAGDVMLGGAGIDRLILDFGLVGGGITFGIDDPTVTTSIRFGTSPAFSFREIESFEIYGTDYADRLTGWINDDTLYGGTGNDTLLGSLGRDRLSGDEGNDLILGGGDYDRLYGGDGNDVLSGEAGDDVMEGGRGNDSLFGGLGDDDIEGGDGSDSLSGGVGNDNLRSDTYYSDQGRERDVLLGYSGNDSIWMGMNDRADGGYGLDDVHVDFTQETGFVRWIFSPAATQFTNGARVAGTETLDYDGGSGRDVIVGWDFNDTLNGFDGNDYLSGGAGSDVLAGGRGNDVLIGGAGNDVLIHESGQDSLYGGHGNDSIVVGFDEGANFPYRVIIGGGAGYDTVRFNSFDIGAVVDLSNQARNDGLAFRKTLSNVEVVEGTDADDYLAGSAARDVFIGNSGSDILIGRGGNDFLSGGASSDVLAGGTGADVFDFVDYSPVEWEGDVITDFTRGQDKLRFDLSDFGPGLRLVNASSPFASTGAPTLIFETDTKRLWHDADGNGGDESPVLVATLTGVGQLAMSDLIFV